MADPGADTSAYRAVGTLYNALMTALILGLVTVSYTHLTLPTILRV